MNLIICPYCDDEMLLANESDVESDDGTIFLYRLYKCSNENCQTRADFYKPMEG